MKAELNPVPDGGIANRVRWLAPSGTSMARQAAQNAFSRQCKFIDFTIGELALFPDELIRQAAISAIAEGRNRYSDTIGLPALRLAIAREISAETALTWTAEEVAVTAGAKPALVFAWLTLLDPGDEVIVPVPYWQTFPSQIRLCGGVPRFVRHRDDGQLDVTDVRRNITDKTRVLLINTPNNPTGAVYRDDILHEMGDIAVEHDLWIVFDQCYRSFVHTGDRHKHITELIPELRKRTITIDSFSKALAIAGWRVGFMLAPNAIITAVRALQSHMTSCANVIGQYGALAYLNAETDRFRKRAVDHLSENRKNGLRILSELNGVDPPLAQGGFYFYLNIARLLGRQAGDTRIHSCDHLTQFLNERTGVGTVPGSAFGDPLSIRISYAVEPDDLREGLERLVRACNSLR